MPSAQDLAEAKTSSKSAAEGSDDAAVELVPYGCTKRFRVSMFPFV